MPQTSADATRFTPTAPHASNMASASASASATANRTVNPLSTRIQYGQAPPNESPAQKIARLRAAAAQARQYQEDTFGKVVRIGRVWADRAHRATSLALLGFTGVVFVIAIAGTTDIVVHNRRRRKAWYADRDLKHKQTIEEATQALAAGTLTPEQMMVLSTERARIEEENKPGVIKRGYNYVFGGLAKEEQKGGRLAARSAKEQIADMMGGVQVVPRAETAETASVNGTETLRPVDAVKALGGPLDRQAQQVYDATTSWPKWLMRQP